MQESPSARPKGSGEVIGDWAQEVSRELNSDVGQPRKGNKDKKDILSVAILFQR